MGLVENPNEARAHLELRESHRETSDPGGQEDEDANVGDIPHTPQEDWGTEWGLEGELGERGLT